MGKKIIMVLASLFLTIITACGERTPSPTMIETAISLTQTAIPTATLIPLSDLDIENILILPGDLPTKFVGEQIKNIMPDKLSALPEPDQVIQQEIKTDIFSGDGITILLYSELLNVETAYKTAIQIFQEEKEMSPTTDVGELASYSETDYPGVLSLPPTTSIQIVFTRCNAMVYIDLFAEGLDFETAITYAQRVDMRLSELVCR